MRTPSLAVAVAMTVAGTIVSSAWASPRHYDMQGALAAEHPFARTGWGGMWPDAGPVRPTLPPEAGLRGYDIGPLLAAPYPYPGTAAVPVGAARPTLPPGDGVGLYDMRPALSRPHPFAATVSPIPPSAPALPAASAAPPVRRPDPAAAPPVRHAPPDAVRAGVPGRSVEETRVGREAARQFYVGGALGAAIVPDMENRGAPLSIDTGTEPGFHLAGAVGRRFADGLRLEFELAYRQAGVDTLDVKNAGSLGLAAGSRPGDGTLSVTAMMFNAGWEFDTGGRVRPFVLGGVGAARIAYSDVKAGGASAFDDSAVVFAWQVGVGASLSVGERWLLDLSYRLFATLDPEFVDTAGEPFEAGFVSHDILIGARYLF